MGCVKKTENAIHSAVHAVQPVIQPIADVALAATGNAEFIPLANAAITGTEDLASGQSLGKSLGQAAISGGEALAGQEVAGAVGIGQGNTAFNNALNITGDNPAGTGLPDIGGWISNAATSASDSVSSALGGVSDTLGLTSGSTGTGGVADNFASSVGSAPTGATIPTSVTLSAGGGFTPASSAIGLGDQATNALLNPDSIAGDTSSATNLGSLDVSPVSNAGTYGQPNLTPSEWGQGIESGGASGTGIGSKAFDAIAQPGAPSGATIAANNATFNSLPDLGGSAAAPATGGAAPSSGGINDYLPSKGDVGKTLLSSALPLGFAGYEAIKGPGKLPSASQTLQPGGAATAPLLNTETNSLNAYNSGTLTQPQMASIQQFVQGQENQIIQQLANSGVTDFKNDSRYLASMQDVQKQAMALQQNYLQASLEAGLSAGGAASKNIAAVAGQQIDQDTAFQNSLAEAMGALGGSVARTKTAA